MKFIFNRRNEIKYVKSSFVAGILISVGCLCYLILGGITGALMFSVGLYLVTFYKVDLFTGISWREHNVKVLFPVLIGNVLGVLISARILATLYPEIIGKVVIRDYSTLEHFMSSVFCGLIMTFSSKGFIIAPLIGCTVLMVTGFSHCITDCFFYSLSGQWNISGWFIVVIGNFIGCNLWRLLNTNKDEL